MPISDIAGCICILKYVVVGVLAVRYMRETTELMFPKFLSLVRNDLEMLMLGILKMFQKMNRWSFYIFGFGVAGRWLHSIRSVLAPFTRGKEKKEKQTC